MHTYKTKTRKGNDQIPLMMNRLRLKCLLTHAHYLNTKAHQKHSSLNRCGLYSIIDTRSIHIHY